MSGIFSQKFHKQTDFKFTIGKYLSYPKKDTGTPYKKYLRFPQKKLSTNLLQLGGLEESLKNRHSQRESNWFKKISFDELSTILHYSAGINRHNKQATEITRRFYPSDGALYPLEIYLAIQRVDGIIPGIYHFNVKDNTLETLTIDSEYMENLLESLAYSWSRQMAVAIFTTITWNRTFVKYNNRGYRAALLEAGHLNHNFAIIAAALNVGCCNSLGFYNQKINDILDIENEGEDSIYMTLLGK